jgi:hypothetical protein
MITAFIGEPFEATVQGFATGLTGIVGVRILDNQGQTTVGRSASGIIEYPAGSGFYQATITAPTRSGQYSVFWDDGTTGPNHIASEDLYVYEKGAVAAPTPPQPVPGMVLSDFVDELKFRGFDGFDTDDLVRYVNFGYRTVARLTKWTWEEATFQMSLDPGEYRWSLAGDLPTLKSVKAVNQVTSGYERRLSAITGDNYYGNWSAYDLTSSQQRGEPDSYYLDSAYLYILPPPQALRDFAITGEQILSELVLVTNEHLITPAEYDEAVLLAAEEHCHVRARQPSFADVNRKKLKEFFEDAMVDENTRMLDAPSRVIPGRTTL